MSTLLSSASIYSTSEMIQILLAVGIDISARNEYNSTLLHSAASRGRVETIQALLDGGINIISQEADACKPLHLAASCFECTALKIFTFCWPPVQL